jgi:tetratricopeptide (TPR) repeat protein
MPPPLAKKQKLLADAQKRFARGHYRESATLYAELLRLEPKNPGVIFNLGSALMLAGDPSSGVRHIARAVAMKPGEAEYLAQLSIAQRQLGKLDDADRASAQAVEADAANPFANWARADFLRIAGRYREAFDLLDPLASPDADATLLIVYAGVARRFGKADEAVERLRAVAAREGLASNTKAEALFALGDLLDKLGRYDEAFEAFDGANTLRRRPYPADELPGQIDAMIGAWSPERLASLPRSTIADERPLFVVGMMRSGSTLCEQILSSHPAVFPGGELDFMRDAHENLLGRHGGDLAAAAEAGAITEKSLTRTGKAYLQKIQKLAGRDAQRITDKMPYNWRHLGLISLMFPNARVVHTVRDPLDTCLSCYFHEFHGSHEYAQDLRALGVYARETRRMMGHWKAALGIPIHDLVYEDLLDGQERVTRELIGFVGLEWDDACLRFHENRRAAVTHSNEQVRETLFTTSRARHMNYDTHIGALRSALAGTPA